MAKLVEQGLIAEWTARFEPEPGDEWPNVEAQYSSAPGRVFLPRWVVIEHRKWANGALSFVAEVSGPIVKKDLTLGQIQLTRKYDQRDELPEWLAELVEAANKLRYASNRI